jgi:WD40 repeat protein
MYTGFRIRLFASVLLLAACLIAPAAATSLGIDWKQSPPLADNVFSGVALTPDGSTVYAGGSQMLIRSWNGNARFGGQPGFIAAMSTDGRYLVVGSGITVTMLLSNGTQLWSRNMDGQIRAVAISENGSFVISADDRGNYNSWAPNGDFYGRNKTDVARRVAVSPTKDLVVATTEGGIRYFTPSLEPVWCDNRSGNLDEYIIISADGSTIVTAGGSRLSSHTEKGIINWQADVTKGAINDVACSGDCSTIVVGSQDNTVLGIDRYGKVHWTYPTTQWANAVSVSENGAVIAAGINDGTVIILDHNGKSVTQYGLEGRIQPRTIAVSRDGSRVVAADARFLYGLELIGNSGADTRSDTIFVAATLNPAPPKTTPAVTATTELPEVTVSSETSPTADAVPVTTKQSPAGCWIALVAVAAACFLMRRR